MWLYMVINYVSLVYILRSLKNNTKPVALNRFIITTSVRWLLQEKTNQRSAEIESIPTYLFPSLSLSFSSVYPSVFCVLTACQFLKLFKFLFLYMVIFIFLIINDPSISAINNKKKKAIIIVKTSCGYRVTCVHVRFVNRCKYYIMVSNGPLSGYNNRVLFYYIHVFDKLKDCILH